MLLPWSSRECGRLRGSWHGLSHLALNSSKDSSWCSARMRDEVLKLGRATAATRGRAARGRRVVARKKEVAGPRAAIRRRDIFLSGRVMTKRERYYSCTGKGRKKKKEKKMEWVW